MTDIAYRTLEGVPMEELHETFLSAFSDYLVRFDMPLWRLEGMLRRRGFRPELSMGAFAPGGELVGFVLNGIRDWQGRPTAYDTGTGVVPEWRRRGITSSIMPPLMDLLRGEGVETYLLEAIVENAPAVDLYRKQGFEVTRELDCYGGQRATLRTASPGDVELHHPDLEDLDWSLLSSFWDFEPSWQNSTDSIMAVPDAMEVVVAMVDGELAGYGVVERATGDIPQLAVAEGIRRAGVGSALLGGLLESVEGERVAMVNVESSPTPTHAFARAVGMEPFTRQYEMVLEL